MTTFVNNNNNNTRLPCSIPMVAIVSRPGLHDAKEASKELIEILIINNNENNVIHVECTKIIIGKVFSINRSTAERMLWTGHQFFGKQ